MTRKKLVGLVGIIFQFLHTVKSLHFDVNSLHVDQVNYIDMNGFEELIKVVFSIHDMSKMLSVVLTF